MKESKSKILIATFFAVLMLMVPLSAVTGTDEMIEKLETKYEKQEFSSTVIEDDELSLINMLYMVGEYNLQLVILEIFEYLEDLGLESIQSGEIVVNSEEIESIVAQTLLSQEEAFVGDVGTTGMGDELYLEGEEPDGELELLYEELQLEFESEETPVPLLPGGKIWRWILKMIFNQRGTLLEVIADADLPQAGYVNGIADFYVLQKDLMGQINYNLSPNVTWVEVIEETAAMFGYPDVNVHDVLYVDLQNRLVDKAENHTRIFEGLGIRAEIYEQYILPILLLLIPCIIDSIYNGLMKKVEFGKGPLTRIKDSFGGFMQAMSEQRGNERRRGMLGNFTKLIGSIFRLCIASAGYLVYMNETQIEEYLQGIYNSVDEYFAAWDSFLYWFSKEPWYDPICINGTIVGPGGRSDNILVYCNVDPETSVSTNETGYFEGLEYKTLGAPSLAFDLPFGIHKCVTTAYDEVDDIGVTVGNLDENGNITAWILNRVLVGSFGGGNITLHIDFADENNNVLLQSQSRAVMQEEEVIREGTTTYNE